MVFLVSGTLKDFCFRASFRCNSANRQMQSRCNLSALLQRITCDCIAYRIVVQIPNTRTHTSDVSVHAQPGDCAQTSAYRIVHICTSGAKLEFGLLPFFVLEESLLTSQHI